MSQEGPGQLNIPNIDRLIEKLKVLPEGKFKMSTYGSHISEDEAYKAGYGAGVGAFGGGLYHECNTACCMAGWANFIRLTEDEGAKPEDVSLHDLADGEKAAKWIGIDYGSARGLFTGHWSAPVNLGIKVLEHLRDHSEVDWGAGQAALRAERHGFEPEN